MAAQILKVKEDWLHLKKVFVSLPWILTKII